MTGGLGGVMEAASRGARSRRGRTLGILPGDGSRGRQRLGRDRGGHGHGRAAQRIVVRSADAVVAVGGGHGTLSEVALALKTGRPVIGLGTWDVHGVEQVGSPREAVERVCALLELPLR